MLGGEDEAEFFDWRRDHHCTIGHDTWIVHGAVIMAGVSVGDGAIVGSGAIVTKDVPAYTIVVGNPARILRRRVSEAAEEKLRKLAWWDWGHAMLAERLADFRALDAEAFADKYAG